MPASGHVKSRYGFSLSLPALPVMILASVLSIATCSSIPFDGISFDNFSFNPFADAEPEAKEGEAGKEITKAKQVEEKAFNKKEESEFTRLERKLEQDFVEVKIEEDEKARKKAEEAARASGEKKKAAAAQRAADEEGLDINRRAQSVSRWVDDVSNRVDGLAKLVEQVPPGLAEVKLSVARIEERLGNIEADLGKPVAKPAPAKLMTKPAPPQPTVQPALTKPKSLMPRPKVSQKGDRAAPFWGVQIGAYKSKAGAENAKSELLLKSTADDMIGAKV